MTSAKMAVTFFFSYTSRNRDAFLDKFVEDLVALLSHRTGRYEDDLVFIDRKQLEPGADWTEGIREALGTCQVFFSLESPGYFQRENCGKEWAVFRKRLEDYARATRQAVPPLHVRIHWFPLQESQIKNIPQPVQRVQDTRRALGGLYETKGLAHLVRLQPEKEYPEALTQLVELAINVLEEHHLPPASEIPDLFEIESAFHCPEKTEAAGIANAGVGHVRFGVIAGALEEVRSFRESVDSYGNEPKDWKPFHPTVTQRIGAIVQRIAASLDLTSDFLQMDDALPEKLEEAEDARNLVVFLLDPWALRLEQRRKHALSYDKEPCLNCALLVPWPGDTQTQAYHERLSDLVRATLARTALREPGTYREEIEGLERLESELIKAITKSTALVVEQGEVKRRAESPWTITMPLLSGPAGDPDGR
jgi:FxsC-like protein